MGLSPYDIQNLSKPFDQLGFETIPVASVEKLVKYIRVVEEALGDGVKIVYESERSGLEKLRRTDTLPIRGRYQKN